MDARLDTSLKSWGRFSESLGDTPTITGHLIYDPLEGISLEIIDDPTGGSFRGQVSQAGTTLFGRLVDGTLVTLAGCFVTQSTVSVGGTGAPTTIHVGQALLGGHVHDLNQAKLKSYSAELSSLAAWMSPGPVEQKLVRSDGRGAGLDINYRVPPPIHVSLPGRDFDFKVSQVWKLGSGSCSRTIEWRAAIMIDAHESMSLEDAGNTAWQCQQLMSLLIGHQTSIRSVIVDQLSTDTEVENSRAWLIYEQLGKHDCTDIDHHKMLAPYDSIAPQFPSIVESWFSRPIQAILAANIYFGAQAFESLPLELRFLTAMQAAESYHRSLGTGFYMNQDTYHAIIQKFLLHLPDEIQDDHRDSVKNRLKYGNQHSLRKRLEALFDRIPEECRLRIAGKVKTFVSKAVATRNFYTHNDLTDETAVFKGKMAYVATQRVQILIVANLLHDLGIKDDDLLRVLQRSQEYNHWLRQELPVT